ncbi:MAG: hypothetical protein AAFV25_15110 [Bacteroidota bacterium]
MSLIIIGICPCDDSGNNGGGGSTTNFATDRFTITDPIANGTTLNLSHSPTFVVDIQYQNGGLTENIDYQINGNQLEFLFPYTDPNPSPTNPYTIQIKYAY